MRVGSRALGEVVTVLCAQGADLRVGALFANLAGLGWVLVSGAVVEAAGEVSFRHGLPGLCWTTNDVDGRAAQSRQKRRPSPGCPAPCPSGRWYARRDDVGDEEMRQREGLGLRIRAGRDDFGDAGDQFSGSIRYRVGVGWSTLRMPKRA